MKKPLYIEMTHLPEGGYSLMKKVEWDDATPEDAKCWVAMYDDETGGLVWEKDNATQERSTRV